MIPEEAFSFLYQTACDELGTIQEQGVTFFNQSRYGQAGEAAGRAEKIKDLAASIEKARETWAVLMPTKHVQPEILPPPLPEPQTQYQRTPPGQRTHQDEYRVPILQALVEMGGDGKTAAVLDRVEQMMDAILNDTDRELLPSGRDIRWRNTGQWARHTMVKEAYLSESSPNGIWEITDEGRKYLENVFRFFSS